MESLSGFIYHSRIRIRKLSPWIRNNYKPLIAGVTLFSIFFINTFHEEYPDEFDNILGGFYIRDGLVIYRDFFTHHGPVPYFLAAILSIFSGNSFVHFRVVYAVFLFLLSIGTFLYIRHTVGSKYSRFWPVFLFVIALSSMYFWGYMLLADSLAGFLLVPVFGILILKSIHRLRLSVFDLTIISIFSFLTILSSLTYIYLILVIYLYTAFMLLTADNFNIRKDNSLLWKPVFIAATPYILFLVYLLITGSTSDYFYQSITFNQKYYIYNYPRADGSTGINPLRFAVVITYNFLNQYSSLLTQIKDFNFAFPVNITLALSNMVLGIYLLLNRRFSAALFVLLIVIFSNARSEPLNSKETDYQSAVYIIFSLLAGTMMLGILYEKIKGNLEYDKKLIYSFLLLLLGTYAVFTSIFFVKVFSSKAFGKYMGTAPLIYDRPIIAPLINEIVEDGETTWVGPFEFEELMYTKPKIASRYQIFNPGMGKSERIHPQLVADFETNKPKVIWYDRSFNILGLSPETYGIQFNEYIQQHYITLYQYYEETNERYVANYAPEPRVDIEKKLYIRKENFDEIVGRLLAKGYIKRGE